MSSNNEPLYEEILREIGLPFDKHVIFDPVFSQDLPPGAFVALQIGIDNFMPNDIRVVIEDFNAWSMALAERQKDVDQEICIARCLLSPLPMQAASYRLTPNAVASACDSCELLSC